MTVARQAKLLSDVLLSIYSLSPNGMGGRMRVAGGWLGGGGWRGAQIDDHLFLHQSSEVILNKETPGSSSFTP